MKAIQTYRLCSLAFGGAVLFGCTVQRDKEIIRADGEIFESVVKTQLPDTVETSVSGRPAVVGFDERPVGDNSTLANAPPPDLTAAADSDSLSRRGLDAIIRRRVAILKQFGIRVGRPFYYPDCGGSRPRFVPDSAGTQLPPSRVAPLNPYDKDKINVLPPPTCPSTVQRYVTVGLPYRGASPILEKVRPPHTPPPDTTAEMWTVYVTESSVGPGGQQYRQYVELYRRDPSSGRLGMAERFLISWAE